LAIPVPVAPNPKEIAPATADIEAINMEVSTAGKYKIIGTVYYDEKKQDYESLAEQAKNKPANIVDKIVEGKMNKYYAENCLLEQPFVKDDSRTIEQVLTDAAKQAGGQAKIRRFVRFEVG